MMGVSRAWSAAAGRQTPIICDLRSQGRLAAKSAMSSRSHCVAATIASFTAAAMKHHGGKRRGIDPTVSARALWLESHPLPSGDDQRRIEPGQLIKSGSTGRTKPNFEVGPQ